MGGVARLLAADRQDQPGIDESDAERMDAVDEEENISRRREKFREATRPRRAHQSRPALTGLNRSPDLLVSSFNPIPNIS